MFTEKDILARLRNGEDAQTIANEMANILNAANKTYEDQKEAEKKRLAAEKAAKEAAAKQMEARKKREADTLVEALGKWVIKYYAKPEEEKEYRRVLAELDGAALIAVADDVVSAMKMVKGMESIFDFKPKDKKNSDDVIAEFLSKMGW